MHAEVMVFFVFCSSFVFVRELRRPETQKAFLAAPSQLNHSKKISVVRLFSHAKRSDSELTVSRLAKKMMMALA